MSERKIIWEIKLEDRKNIGKKRVRDKNEYKSENCNKTELWRKVS